MKKPLTALELLRANPVAQSQLGQADGWMRAGRAFLFEALAEAWAAVRRGDSLS